MQAFRSSSVGESWSNGFGRSAREMQGAVVSTVFINVTFYFDATLVRMADYKFFMKNLVIILNAISL